MVDVSYPAYDMIRHQRPLSSDPHCEVQPATCGGRTRRGNSVTTMLIRHAYERFKAPYRSLRDECKIFDAVRGHDMLGSRCRAPGVFIRDTIYYYSYYYSYSYGYHMLDH